LYPPYPKCIRIFPFRLAPTDSFSCNIQEYKNTTYNNSPNATLALLIPPRSDPLLPVEPRDPTRMCIRICVSAGITYRLAPHHHASHSGAPGSTPPRTRSHTAMPSTPGDPPAESRIRDSRLIRSIGRPVDISYVRAHRPRIPPYPKCIHLFPFRPAPTGSIHTYIHIYKNTIYKYSLSVDALLSQHPTKEKPSSLWGTLCETDVYPYICIRRHNVCPAATAPTPSSDADSRIAPW
jgi:hypothetical protein